MQETIKTIKMDKSVFAVFSSFEEADAADRTYWHFKTSLERLEALELMRQSAYGYEDPTASRLERVLEVARLKQS